MQTSVPHDLSSFLQRRVVILHGSTPARQAARAMCEREVGCVLVIDESSDLAGIVTDRDLACAEQVWEPTAELTVSQIMSPDPAAADQSSSLDEVIGLMEDRGVRRIPITREEHGARKCVGIVTLDDLLAAELIPSARVARIVKSQIQKRASARGPGAVALRAWRAETRSEAHRQQTLNHFYNVVAERTGNTSREVVRDVSRLLLSALVRRIHFSAAAQLIGQLPHDLHDELFDLPAGPDRTISVESLAAALVSRFQVPREEVHGLLRNFYGALGDMIAPGELEDLKSQLPADLRSLFEPEPLRATGT